MKTIRNYLMVVVCLSLLSSLAAGYTGGTGSPEDPFQIASKDDFLAMTTASGDWGSCFILTADIDLAGLTFDNSPIAHEITKGIEGNFDGTLFSGTFDGDGHRISNLTIHSATGFRYIALFGNTSYATIKDLRLVDVNITISDVLSWYVGALVGEMYQGSVTNCSSSGTITACNGSQSVAGLVGSQDWGTISQCSSSVSITAGNDCGDISGLVGACSAGTIQRCFSTGAITGGNKNLNLAGLVGYHNSSFAEYAISDCYSTGNISAGPNSRNIGGLIGANSSGNVDRCYSAGLITAGAGSTAVAGCLGYVGAGSAFKSLFWDTDTSKQTIGVGSGSSSHVYGRTTGEMMNRPTFTSAPGWNENWDFSNDDGNPAVWMISTGYPLLVWTQTGAGGYSGGTGIPGDPYQVATVDELLLLSNSPADWDKAIILTANIDLAGRGSNTDGSFQWSIIAPYNGYVFQGISFTGRFNGNGHKISNMTIKPWDQNISYLGLFGYLGAGAVVENLAVENAAITGGTGSQYIGGVCGANDGTITNCSAMGTFSGRYSVGGMCGDNKSGTISHCFATGAVNGQSDLGGLCGNNGAYTSSAGTIQHCYATSTVSNTVAESSYNVGGLCGQNWGTVSQSYATGAVTGQYYFGGLNGHNLGTIVDCYATGAVSGLWSGGGLCGLDEQGKIIRCYSTGLISVEMLSGGFCGKAYTDGTYGSHGVTYEDTANFWDGETANTWTSAMGTGNSTADMKMQATFAGAGWDFTDTDGNPAVWKMTSEGSSYPTLAWQPDLERYGGGDGTAANPWQIATKDDLILLSNSPDDWTQSFIVTANVDLAGTVFDKAPIAPDTDDATDDFQGISFSGTFNGNGHSISNLTISNTTGGDFLALFGYADGATIQNLSLNGVLIDALGGDSLYIGGLIGYQNLGLTQNCSSSGTIHAGSYDPLFGGDVAGYASGLIGNCKGEYWEFLTVNRCSSSVEVHGTFYVGGLVGYQSNCTLRECFSTGSVEGYQQIGGLVGTGVGIIERCFTTAAVRNLYGGLYLGGMAGYHGGIISDSYARSAIYVHSGSSYIGGFVGSSFGIDRCYSASTITLRDYVQDYVGAFVGQSQGSVSACFYDSQVAGWTGDPSDASGLTTAQMQTADEFINVGWDFEPQAIDGTPAVWKIDGVDYPTLVWYVPAQATYSGGKGTLDDPYQIAAVAELLHLFATAADWDKHFILTADVDLIGKTFDKAPIAPDIDDDTDEFQGTPFSGVFDGNGHAIRNLTIDNSVSSDYLGLFGYLNNATIRNLRIENAHIVAGGILSYYVGALAGYMNNTRVSGCSSSGLVSCDLSSLSTYSIGGLVGYAQCDSSPAVVSLEDSISTAQVEGSLFVGGLVGSQGYCGIVRCQTSGMVTGFQGVGGLVGANMYGPIDQCSTTSGVLAPDGGNYAGGLVGLFYGDMTDSCSVGSLILGNSRSYSGGLVGYNFGSIVRCYSACLIERGNNNAALGGLVGSNNGAVSDSFWDIWASGISFGAGGIGLGTGEMMQRSTFVDAGWDFDPSSVDDTPAVWMIQDGADYPRLVAFRYGAGGGTPGNPYTIDSVEKLLFLSDTPEDWDKSFVLTADIDLGGHTFDRAPIAPDNDPSEIKMFDGVAFTGTFDGHGHTISNLTIVTEDGGDYLGLIGEADYATIRNLRMDNVSITAFGGNRNLGALVGGMFNSQISLCVVSGTITAGRVSAADSFENVGGLVGDWHYGLIENCAARVNISSGINGVYIGGLVGLIADGTIRHAVAAGAIDCGQHTQHIGGLAGYVQPAIIENSCALGSISVGTNYYGVGGLVGFLSSGQVQNSYSTASMSFTGTGLGVGGIVGYAGGSVIGSFWDIEASGIGLPWGGAGTGLTTSEMMRKANFTAAGWDFDAASIDGDPADWRIREGHDYPRPAWQPLVPGDIAGSPAVDLADLMAVAAEWMQACSGCPADVNGDGVVNMLDFVILGGSWLSQP